MDADLTRKIVLAKCCLTSGLFVLNRLILCTMAVESSEDGSLLQCNNGSWKLARHTFQSFGEYETHRDS